MPGVAYAVVRSEPPQVFLATDVDVLHRVLASELVARTPSDVQTNSETEAIRRALLDERWGDAVLGWIDLMGIEATRRIACLPKNLPEAAAGAHRISHRCFETLNSRFH